MFQPYDPVAEIVRDMTRHILTDSPLRSRIYMDRTHSVADELAGYFSEYLPAADCARLLRQDYVGECMTAELIELYAHWAVEHDAARYDREEEVTEWEEA